MQQQQDSRTRKHRKLRVFMGPARCSPSKIYLVRATVNVQSTWHEPRPECKRALLCKDGPAASPAAESARNDLRMTEKTIPGTCVENKCILCFVTRFPFGMELTWHPGGVASRKGKRGHSNYMYMFELQYRFCRCCTLHICVQGLRMGAGMLRVGQGSTSTS